MQLFEFALVLPLLLVMAVGVVDFGVGWNLKQKLTNAAREGARIAISQSRADLTQTAPASVQAVCTAVKNYMTNAALDTSFLNCANPTPTATYAEWEYTHSVTGQTILIIRREEPVPVPDPFGGGPVLAVCTRITLSYPYSWMFHRVIRLLKPTASYAGSFLVTTQVVMKDLT